MSAGSSPHAAASDYHPPPLPLPDASRLPALLTGLLLASCASVPAPPPAPAAIAQPHAAALPAPVAPPPDDFPWACSLDLSHDNLVLAIKDAGAKPEDAARMTVYGIAIHGGWSFGIAVFSDPRGKYLGRAGWGMRVGFAHPCEGADGG